MQVTSKKSSNALVVMLKAPVAGRVKTRLVPPLKAEDAARLYSYFIEDIFNRISILTDVDIIAALGTDLKSVPRVLAKKVKRILPSGILVTPQKGKDLGERLANIFSLLFLKGYNKVAIIGTDSPDLPVEFIKKSFAMLIGIVNLVIGPAEDGGYYLIAMSKDCRQIFKDIPWSTNMVFEKTIEKAQKAGLKSDILPIWYDVDDINNLKTLWSNTRLNIPETKTSKLLKKIFKDTPCPF
ncbi:MAG: TIGR04282 family arsenosugar biosynthesis glycosyltransferase [Deltaproteobacteria bacterium]|nr:TIGR04282 family arsenosugar biosynthesis glycosyltransferase [Deltaproteobacteria bacterium]